MEITTPPNARALRDTLRRARKDFERRLEITKRIKVEDEDDIRYAYETEDLRIVVAYEDGWGIYIERNETGALIFIPTIVYSNVEGALNYLVTFIVRNWHVSGIVTLDD